MLRRHLFTSESVTEGHPDKICDQISDAILDAFLVQDPFARVACETVANTGYILVTGQITSSARIDIPLVVREVVADIGYTNSRFGFDAASCAVFVAVEQQSPDIAAAVDLSWELRGGVSLAEIDAKIDGIGAGDQGLMFGFACDETPEFMPLPISLAHRLARQLAQARKGGRLDWLRPDGKTQVTVEYEDGQPVRVDTILISTQHSPEVDHAAISAGLMEHVVIPVVPEELRQHTRYFFNPSGRFVIGGPQGDAGLTGRKIIVDSYGGYARHGGGAFSGKDPTKVDRSGTYAARYAAKNLVAAGLARKCEVQISYAIGVARPTSIAVETFNTNAIAEQAIEEVIKQVFDLRPAGIIRSLDLRRPVYRQVANYGHFGRGDLDLPWERLDKVTAIKEVVASMVHT
ncbi:MAG: methionine adenosyltransferase [Cyanobacteria bacterium NC_groundwater_1444_Ag_S-0.65um_54_12]|nr:methionine adenosyltransferase [Cyanobacteria bacterium NC_groundwater_1444_Ag_S-0.65um_54_12]